MDEHEVGEFLSLVRNAKSEWEIEEQLEKAVSNPTAGLSVGLAELLHGESHIDDFKLLVEYLRNQVQNPPGGLIQYLAKVALNQGRDFQVIFKKLRGLYCAILLGCFSRDKQEQLERMADFFHLLKVLLILVPELAEDDARTNLSERPSEPEEGDYDQEYALALDYVLGEELVPRIVGGRLQLTTGMSEEEWEDLDCDGDISTFNEQEAPFELDFATLEALNASEADWFSLLLGNFYSESEAEAICSRLESSVSRNSEQR